MKRFYDPFDILFRCGFYGVIIGLALFILTGIIQLVFKLIFTIIRGIYRLCKRSHQKRRYRKWQRMAKEYYGESLIRA